MNNPMLGKMEFFYGPITGFFHGKDQESHSHHIFYSQKMMVPLWKFTTSTMAGGWPTPPKNDGLRQLGYYSNTIWLFNIAMENQPFLIGKQSINGQFSMAMLNNQRVYGKKKHVPNHQPDGFDWGCLIWTDFFEMSLYFSSCGAVPKCRRGFSLVRPQLLFATVFGVAGPAASGGFCDFPCGANELVFFFLM